MSEQSTATPPTTTTSVTKEASAPFLEGLFDDPKLVKFAPDNPRGLRAAPFVTDVAEFMKTRKVDDLIRVLNELYSYACISFVLASKVSLRLQKVQIHGT